MGILEQLVQKKLISSDDISAVRAEIRQSNSNVEAVLLKRGISLGDIMSAKGDSLGIPSRAVGDDQIPFDILRYIPEESAMHYKIVPIGLQDKVLEVGVVDPDNFEARDAINFIASKAGLPFKLFLISEADFKKVVEQYRGFSGEVTKALFELETELTADEAELTAQVKKERSKAKDQGNAPDKQIVEDAPVTKIVATIIHYASSGSASDIHIENVGDKIRVRFRVDGVLNTSLILPIKLHASLVARIKILSNMRLDEKRKPQDGRFSAKIEGRKVDFRVSTFPAYYGEKVVMRILDSQKGVLPLEELGLSERNLRLIRNAVDAPYGMILISGPTGSGKSTTLYSMINQLDMEESNVLSLEDPVEYSITGMNQSQVHPEIGYSFASGLRSVLRQDPDVIMVGEIRDKETAQLAVQAALTGHLVLSTIHTNNVAGVIPRLVDMGVDPYLIAPTLILAMAQRLVKKLCPGGGGPIPVDGSLRKMIEKEFSGVPEKFRKEVEFKDTVYRAVPVDGYPLGTSGRLAVFEVLEMNKELEGVILKNPIEAEIMKVAREQGMLLMKEDAVVKAFNREIPFEEINKL